MSRLEMCLRSKDVLAGLFFLAVAGLFGYAAAILPLGTALRMGPGYFPLLLSGTLALLGLITLVGGILNASPATAIEPFFLSRVLIISLSGLAFALGLEPLGFPIALFLTVMIASTASRSFRLIPTIALAVGVALVSWVLFAKILGIQLHALGSWLV